VARQGKGPARQVSKWKARQVAVGKARQVAIGEGRQGKWQGEERQSKARQGSMCPF